MGTTGNPEFDGFIAKYTREIAADFHASFAKLRARLPGATILVYDNYNALAAGFATSEKASDAIVSIVAYPRWLTLFFLRGVGLEDPHGLLTGKGRQVRSIRLATPDALDDPRVVALIDCALATAEPRLDQNAAGKIIIKSISVKQRSRRPVAV